MSIVVSDDESMSGHVVSQPRQNVTLSSRLTDANNDATPELSAHRNKPPVPAISAQKPVPTGSKRGAKDVVLDVVSVGDAQTECVSSTVEDVLGLAQAYVKQVRDDKLYRPRLTTPEG
ncbi:uncharacterized protein EDB93DRAFT_1248505 [Suillus bovinus]|uniref:uncharacterized protein n=1 Tax=Suillus bovinus TaxID=48563 RepID=UPI001B8714F8|nr:uncharacterized protein EDB93DRAFT_1248505 [Suillus bovinus]KAG2154308.1 hypothetical protein EDB93DRAFT_1248505 [Suillus bovinus]